MAQGLLQGPCAPRVEPGVVGAGTLVVVFCCVLFFFVCFCMRGSVLPNKGHLIRDSGSLEAGRAFIEESPSLHWRNDTERGRAWPKATQRDSGRPGLAEWGALCDHRGCQADCGDQGLCLIRSLTQQVVTGTCFEAQGSETTLSLASPTRLPCSRTQAELPLGFLMCFCALLQKFPSLRLTRCGLPLGSGFH